MYLAMLTVRGCLGLVALGCICLSAYFAFEFGLTKSDDPLYAQAAAWLCLGLDLTKSGILIISLGSPRRERQAAVAGFWILTFLSLWAAQGNSAQQTSLKLTTKLTASSTLDTRKEDLRKLEKRREDMVFTVTTAETVTAAKTAATEAERQRALECDGARGKAGNECRIKERAKGTADQALVKAEEQRGLTVAAEKLDDEIKVARAKRDEIKTSDTLKSADAQSESISKGTGMSVELAAMIGHWLFALGVEIGSGLLPWQLFASMHRHPVEAQEAPSKPRQEPIQHPSPIPLPETAVEARKRFFDAVVIPDQVEMVNATEMHVAYLTWGRVNGIKNPMLIHMFGTHAPWPKRKVNGRMYYIGCQIAEAYKPGLRIVSSNA